ncbi:hypothetical protein [Aeromicrobium sp.]|uniref:hypothetical protein n=1 Tax=Aeromicrobium sp. TaxID=1871063 RepID=UPI003D6AC13C
MSSTTSARMTAGGHPIALVRDQTDERGMGADEVESLRSFTYVLKIASRLVVLQTIASKQLRRDLDTLHAELTQPNTRRSVITVLLDEIHRALYSGQLPESVRIVLESGPHPRPDAIA